MSNVEQSRISWSPLRAPQTVALVNVITPSTAYRSSSSETAACKKYAWYHWSIVIKLRHFTNTCTYTYMYVQSRIYRVKWISRNILLRQDTLKGSMVRTVQFKYIVVHVHVCEVVPSEMIQNSYCSQLSSMPSSGYKSSQFTVSVISINNSSTISAPSDGIASLSSVIQAV